MNNENNTSRKDIIKNIAIIFLAVMLVLTLFSNTIMNYSLPQVSAIYVSQGTISEQIRGSGTVEPAESYEVKLEQSRKIKNVLVKAGQEVKAGDVLFELEDEESKELTEAQNTLDSLQLEYDKAVLALSNGSGYGSELLAISNAERELDERRLELDSLKRELGEKNKELSELEQQHKDRKALEEANKNKEYEDTPEDIEYKAAKAEITRLTREKDDLSTQLASVDTEDMLDLSGSYYDRLRSAKDAVTEAERKADTAQKEYDEAAQDAAAGSDYEEELAAKQKEIRMTQSAINDLYSQYYNLPEGADVSSIATAIAEKNAELQELRNDISRIMTKSTDNLVLNSKFKQAELKLKKCQKALTNAKDTLSSELRSIKLELKGKINKLNDELIAANERLETAEENRDKSKDEASKEQEGVLTAADLAAKVESKKAEVKSQEKAIKDQEKSIRDQEKTIADLHTNLEIKQSDDSINNQSGQLDLAAKRKAISQQQEKIDKLKSETFDVKVTAQMGGIVERISVTAGENTEAGTTAAVINVSDKGYTLEFAVKTEQSKKVKVGDKAEITSWYWGDDFTATLSEIRADTNNPQTQKILAFTIQGSDITTGQNISLAMGSKGQSYSTVVPNSAIREDSNGSFVLVMESQSSPLGNRYKAVRYDIEILAKDDNNCAVSGLMGSEFVITTSTKPISPGEQVLPASD